MTGLGKKARARAAKLNTTSDGSIQTLQDAKEHLKKHNANYEEAFDAFQKVISDASQQHARDKEAADAAQGILIAAALSVLLPEAILVGVAVKLVGAAAKETTKTIVAAGFGEAMEGVAAEMADEVNEKAGTPNEDPAKTVKTVESSGDRYKQAFGSLDQMITALPKLGASATSQMNLGAAADLLSKEAIRVGGGQDAKFSAGEIEAKAKLLERQFATDLTIEVRANESKARLNRLAAAITALELSTPKQMETVIWQQWMAHLGSNHNVLDNAKIEKYLGQEGLKLIDPGSYFFDSESQSYVTEAQRSWLNSKGYMIMEGRPPEEIQKLFDGAQKYERMKSDLIGQTGTATSASTLSVGGREFEATMSGNGNEYLVTAVGLKGGLTADGSYDDKRFRLTAIGTGPSLLPEVPNVELPSPGESPKDMLDIGLLELPYIAPPSSP